MTVDERLASIDTNIALLDQRLEVHTTSDSTNFQELKTQLDTIELKVDALRLAEAVRSAPAANSKREATVFGGGVAAALVGLVEGLKYFVG